MELNKKQENGIKSAIDWFYNIGTPQVFTIAGYAGTGKTTLVHFIIEALKIPIESVRFVSFTGKAASVLTQKGNPATTIHKLIYNIKPKEEYEDEIEFILKSNEEFDESLRLLIVDEISMVSKELMSDLLSFHVKTILLGDPFQLPPVQGDNNGFLKNPDVFLDEVMRQSLENPILYLANKLRNKERINYGEYGDSMVIRRSDLRDNYFTDVDQIICGKNKTVMNLNKYYRNHFLGATNCKPMVGEKLLCLRNNWSKEVSEGNICQSLINGLSGSVTDISPNINRNMGTMLFNFKPDFFKENEFCNILCDYLYFRDSIISDNDIYNNYEMYKQEIYHRKEFDKQGGGKIDKFTYGYAITCYKSQGSEFGSVLYVDEYLSKELYYQHFYTAVTRAKDQIIIVK